MNASPAELDGPPRAQGLLRRSWPAFFVLLVTLGLTLLAARLAQEQVETKIESLIEAQSSAILTRLSTALGQQEDVLRSIQGLHAMNIQVVRDVFELFATAPAEMHKSVKCIAYAPRVRAGDLHGYEAYARNQGLSYLQFAVHPAGSRAEYFPLEYLVPFARNAADLGFDLRSDTRRAAALNAVAQTGEITATTLLVDAKDGEPTFQLIAPIYEGSSSLPTQRTRAKALSGVCVVELYARRFIIEAVVRNIDSSVVSVSVFDGSAPSDESRIYSEPLPEGAFRTRTSNLDFAGHTWTVEIHAGKELASAINTSLPWYVLITGAVISFLLFGFVLSLSNSRQHAIGLAEKMTRSLRRIVESSSDMIGSTDIEGRWKSTNNASISILRYRPEELVGKKHEDFVLDADRTHVTEALRTAPDEQSIKLAARYRTKEGDIRWVSWSITRSNRDGEIYCIGRDVTERVLAEKAIEAKSKQLFLAGIITDRENKRKELSIREQNIQFRMQLTTVMGFLQLILAHQDFTLDEILDYVKEANTGAEGLLEDLIRMTSVELRHIEDVSFDLSSVSAGDMLRIVTDRLTMQLPDTPLKIEEVPQSFSQVQCTMDAEKLQYAVDHIVGVLRPYTMPETNLTARVSGTEGTLVAELQFESVRPVDAMVISAINGNGGDISFHEKESDFALALMHAYLDVMGAHIEIERTGSSGGTVIRIVFQL